VGWDIVINIAAHCRLDSLGFESWWGEIFRALHIGSEVHPASCTVGKLLGGSGNALC